MGFELPRISLELPTTPLEAETKVGSRNASQGITTTAAASRIPIPDVAPLRLAVSDKIQDRSHHYETCQCKKQASCDSGCPRLAQREVKTPEHDGCRKQLDQAAPAKSQQRRAVRSPSRPERDDGLHAHPDKGDDLKLKNLPRKVSQRRCCRSRHKKIRNHSTPWLLGRKPDAAPALIAALRIP